MSLRALTIADLIFWNFASLREMCPNTEFFSEFSPNAINNGPEKTPYLDTFHGVYDFSRGLIYYK